MEKVLVKDLVLNASSYNGREIEINGWIRNNRDQKSSAL